METELRLVFETILESNIRIQSDGWRYFDCVDHLCIIRRRLARLESQEC